MILRNGTIYTVNEAQPWAEAVAVKDDLIIFVGSNQGVDSMQGALTQVIDLNGRMVLPGLHDSHLHVLEAGSSVGGTCMLTPDTPPEQFIPLLRQCAPNQVGTNWVLGFGYTIHTLLESERLPVEILDQAIPDRPAVMLEETSHSVWVNSAALTVAGIDADTPNPPGGVISKDSITGEPDGILFDNAGNIVLDLAFSRTPELDQLNYEGLLYGLDKVAENGITSIVDARVYWTRGYHEVWQRAENEGTLTARTILALWAYPHFDDDQQLQDLKSMYSNEPNGLLRISQIKMYSDGIINNTTSALLEPYLQDLGVTGDFGLNYFDESRLTRYVTELEQLGFDIHIHTIGDRAVREALNAIEAAINANGAAIDRRHRLTHLELIHPDDRPRFAALAVIADFQVAGDFTLPENDTLNEPFIGIRAFDTIPIRSIYDTGARVTLSSDWDVSALSPFVGMANSLLRDDRSLPNLDAAIRAYTINAAYLMRQEDRTGSIEVGKFADLIVIDQNIFEIPTEQIGETTVLLTLLGGEEVFRSPLLTSIGEKGTIPDDFILEHNYPNPFNINTHPFCFTFCKSCYRMSPKIL